MLGFRLPNYSLIPLRVFSSRLQHIDAMIPGQVSKLVTSVGFDEEKTNTRMCYKCGGQTGGPLAEDAASDLLKYLRFGPATRTRAPSRG